VKLDIFDGLMLLAVVFIFLCLFNTCKLSDVSKENKRLSNIYNNIPLGVMQDELEKLDRNQQHLLERHYYQDKKVESLWQKINKRKNL